MSVAFLFPGQGAQQVGMLADLAASSPAARAVFQQADAQLGYALGDLCLRGPEDRLNATDVSQPAIFVCSIAVLAAAREALGDRFETPAMLAGLSLGEYTALCVAGAMDFSSALALVAQRGRFMQEACEARPSGMVSIIGLDEAKVGELCRAAAGGEVLGPANFNCPGQIVISGAAGACARAVELAPRFGASGAVPLKVAGAFHSRLMQPAAEKLAAAIRGVEVGAPAVPVISNVDAQPYCCPDSIKEKLVAQVTSPVRWAQSMRFMLDSGADRFYEIGPGRVLAGLMRRIERRATVVNVNSAEALAKLAQ